MKDTEEIVIVVGERRLVALSGSVSFETHTNNRYFDTRGVDYESAKTH